MANTVARSRPGSVAGLMSVVLFALFVFASFLVWRNGRLDAGWFSALWLLSVIGMASAWRSVQARRDAGMPYTWAMAILAIWITAWVPLTVSIIWIGAVGKWA